jgi:hypothetical protein
MVDLSGRAMRPQGISAKKWEKAPRLGEGEDRWDDLNPRRRKEIRRVFLKWDSDQSGFLEPSELRAACEELGLQFDPQAIVKVCTVNGGGLNRDQFFIFMAAQFHFMETIGLKDDRQTTGHAGEVMDCANRELQLADRHLRESSNTYRDKNGNYKWRPLILTRHYQIGEHALGVRLYFDLLVVLCIGLVTMGIFSSAFMAACYNGTGGGQVLSQVDPMLMRFTRLTIGNLEKRSVADATGFCASDALGSAIFVGLIMAFRLLLMPRAIVRAAGGARVEDLTIRVRHLPRDIGRFHRDYSDQLLEHFTDLLTENAALEGTDEVDHPVREVSLWYDYQGDIDGVLRQVELLKQERFIVAELDLISVKASQLDPEADIKALVNRNMDEFDETHDHHAGSSSGSGSEEGDGRKAAPVKRRQSHFVAAKIGERGYDQAMAPSRCGNGCCGRDWQVILEERREELTARREMLQERMLAIETARSEHSDMQAHQRDVCGAFVVFWSQRARDTILHKYGWSRCRCCRRFQGKQLQFQPSADADNWSGSEDGGEDHLIAGHRVLVEAAQDPSLQLWENLDVSRAARRSLHWQTRCGSCCMYLFAALIAFAVRASQPDLPIALPVTAPVWIIADASPAGEREPCWRVCELELFKDAGCTEPVHPRTWISSNKIHEGGDAGLQAVHDKNLAFGSVCHEDWRPSSCWRSLNLSTIGQLCAAETPCSYNASAGGRRARACGGDRRRRGVQPQGP